MGRTCERCIVNLRGPGNIFTSDATISLLRRTGVGIYVHFQGLNLTLSSSSSLSLFDRWSRADMAKWNVPVCLSLSRSLSTSLFAWVLVESRLTDGAALQDTICAAIVPECEH